MNDLGGGLKVVLTETHRILEITEELKQQGLEQAKLLNGLKSSFDDGDRQRQIILDQRQRDLDQRQRELDQRQRDQEQHQRDQEQHQRDQEQHQREWEDLRNNVKVTVKHMQETLGKFCVRNS